MSTRQVIIALILFGILGCAPTYMVNKIEKSNFNKLSVAVAPIISATIAFPGSVEKDFGKGNKDSLIIDYLQKSISKGLKEKSSFKSVELCQFRGQPTIEYESIKYKDEIIKTLKPLPDSGFVTCNNDVVLMIYNVYIDTVTKENRYEDVEISTTSLDFYGEYVYWNTKLKAILSYGKIRKDYSSTNQSVHISNWNKLVDKIVEELLVEGNYSKEK